METPPSRATWTRGRVMTLSWRNSRVSKYTRGWNALQRIWRSRKSEKWGRVTGAGDLRV